MKWFLRKKKFNIDENRDLIKKYEEELKNKIRKKINKFLMKIKKNIYKDINKKSKKGKNKLVYSKIIDTRDYYFTKGQLDTIKNLNDFIDELKKYLFDGLSFLLKGGYNIDIKYEKNVIVRDPHTHEEIKEIVVYIKWE